MSFNLNIITDEIVRMYFVVILILCTAVIPDTEPKTLASSRHRHRLDTPLHRNGTSPKMGSIGNKPRLFGTHNPPCTRSQQIVALALVIVTFFLTRLFDQFTSSCTNSSSPSHVQFRSGDGVVGFTGGEWPLRGYGPHLSVKIYVYDENEIDGLKQLLYGRDGKISADSCLKGQWGTQVHFFAQFSMILLRLTV